MAVDRITQALIDALKQGLADKEQRLFRSGKQAGIFPGKTGIHAEAAAQALRDGLLEVVRTETRGKTACEWVRVTPRGVDFLAHHESPVRALDELREALQMTREGVPAWLAQVGRTLQELGQRLAEEVQRANRRLEALSQRVSEALERDQETRAQRHIQALPTDSGDTFPWALDALGYLERRRDSGAAHPCPLPELFAALRGQHGDLTVRDFHAGLRHMQERGVLRLLPFDGPGELPEPEYALLEGAGVYYFVSR